jgi:hypothetical protein
VKCHSCRSASETGAAKKAGLGFDEGDDSSAVSLRSRRIVGLGAMVGPRWALVQAGVVDVLGYGHE